MNKLKLKKDLELIHRHLTRAEVVMWKISDKLGIDRGHEGLDKTIYEVEQLLKMFNDDTSKEIPTK